MSHDYALIVSIISLAWQAINGYLLMRARAEHADLIERLDQRYVLRREYEIEVKRIDDRLPTRRAA